MTISRSAPTDRLQQSNPFGSSEMAAKNRLEPLQGSTEHPHGIAPGERALQQSAWSAGALPGHPTEQPHVWYHLW
jgi:hypothetical protein